MIDRLQPSGAIGPTPTDQTNEMIYREITNLRAVMEGELRGLRSLLDERYTLQTRAIDTALNAAEKAAIRTEAVLEKRFDSVNEWRRTVADIIGTAVPRHEVEGKWASFEGRLNALEKGGVYLTREGYEQAHESLRTQLEINRTSLIEHAASDERWQADLRQQIVSLRARMYGASAAVVTIMAVIMALVALLRINA